MRHLGYLTHLLELFRIIWNVLAVRVSDHKYSLISCSSILFRLWFYVICLHSSDVKKSSKWWPVPRAREKFWHVNTWWHWFGHAKKKLVQRKIMVILCNSDLLALSMLYPWFVKASDCNGFKIIFMFLLLYVYIVWFLYLYELLLCLFHFKKKKNLLTGSFGVYSLQSLGLRWLHNYKHINKLLNYCSQLVILYFRFHKLY
jgi:hypothetical protein